ncbi:BtrH N-terminal domain-containing protein [Clostridium botulinum]
MIIDNFKVFKGESCETTTVGNLLKNNGIVLSGPMLFVIGEGLGFIYWDSKQMGFPFLGGRCRQNVLMERIVKNLNLNIDVRETTSKAKAWKCVGRENKYGFRI